MDPGDTKKRLGWLGSLMPYPRVIPHRDAAGVDDFPVTAKQQATDLTAAEAAGALSITMGAPLPSGI